MKTVELVCHCDARQIPAFASMLTAELSSLIAHPAEECFVKVCVCTSPDDRLTHLVCEAFIDRFHETDNMLCYMRRFADENLFRRAIGRNKAFKESTADVCWAIDADYWLGEGCLDAIANLDFSNGTILYPRQAMIHVSHDVGDREIARVVPGELFTPDLSLFEPWRIKKAIGGLQIVSGDTARKGYLDGTKWVEPVPNAKHFLNTVEDMKFRDACGGSVGVDVPGLYRFRHSESAFEDKEKRLRKAGRA